MRLPAALCSVLLTGLTAAPCLAAPPVPALPLPPATGAPPAPPAAAPVPPAALSVQETTVELLRLRLALEQEVPHLAARSPARDRAWIAMAQKAVAFARLPVERPQLLVIVDRNPRVQELRIVLARPDGAWEVVGGAHVSTGQTGRFDHYITPTGVFLHNGSILDYRAEGTFNENHIRGLGLKGMRVWDFGWQWARRGWGDNEAPIQIRLEMHATDPDMLEQRLGHPASEGCVRIPAALNRFMDRHGVLDADYERMAAANPRIRALMAPDRTPTPLAGDALVVVDSALPLPPRRSTAERVAALSAKGNPALR